MNKEIKVGDKVRVLPTAIGFAVNYINEIVTVKNVPSDKYILVTATNGLSFSLTTEKHNYGLEFELVTESFPEKWWIKPNTIEEATEVAKWVDENFSLSTRNYYSDGVHFHFKACEGYANKGKGYILHRFCPDGHTKITFEQFQKYVLKQEQMKSRFPFTLTEENYKRIVRIACEGWQTKLISKWSLDIIKDGVVVIEEEFYKEMRKACTAKQHELFDEIFGEDEPEWTLKDAKDGEPVWVRNSNTYPWEFRYASGKGEAYNNQNKSGGTTGWKYARKFDTNNLPVNS